MKEDRLAGAELDQEAVMADGMARREDEVTPLAISTSPVTVSKVEFATVVPAEQLVRGIARVRRLLREAEIGIA